ncbi:hypothetical protein [Lentzea atacamensis]|uniref:hypothetical protein n=1 Tax=Lentzea atacamensis TaxID=531938 RepID=UPI001B86E273|nr:hypothetical protein [Lentzea atacamensis]
MGQQAFALRALLPTAVITIGASTLTAVFELQPTSASLRYRVRLHYRHGTAPEVTVVHPTLILRDGAESLPHTYPGDKLCLHLPGQWRPTMLLANTIVPWASEWLLYYEIWLVTGAWHGGGHGTPTGP